MSVEVEKIFKDAINLNPIEKAELIDRLFDSFSNDKKYIIHEKNWKEEIRERKAAYEQGKIPSDSIENVFGRLSKK